MTDVQVRIASLRAQIDALPLARRVALLSGADFWSTEAEPDASIPAFVLTDGPHGVRRQPEGADHLGIGTSVPATCWPTGALLGATWDPDLITEVGAALGREARALGVGVLLGPSLNVKRHPAGGRNFEYLSEDPLLSGRVAAAMIRGIQAEGVGACAKHFVANNHESYRMVVDVVVDERTLRELYLRGFEIAVTEGEPWTVMTAYNRVNGEYVADSDHLLHDVLRREWGFDGLVVTDWGGVHDRTAGVHAGLDLEMPSSGGAHDAVVIDAVESGELDESAVTDRALAVASLGQRIAERRAVDQDVEHDVDQVGHHRLARRVAAAGTVLLRNDGVLPLDPALDVAIVGAFAESPRFQGAGSSQVVPTRLDDARRTLEERLRGRVRYAPGYDPTTGESDPAAIATAARLAAASDVAVVFVGLPAIAEAEGIDRDHLRLPPAHDELVTAVCAANARTVVVLANGAPVLLPWADRPAAILEAYLGGQASGSAITDVLVGDAEPGGRLAETFPSARVFPAEENFRGHPRQVQYREGLYVGYRYFTSSGVRPQFPFGHGLSYTTFRWSDPDVRTDHDGSTTVTVDVTNTGHRLGSEVVQVYVRRSDDSAVYRPERELRGFAKLTLAPGETATACVDLDRRAFAHWDVGAAAWVVERGGYDLLVAASSADVRAMSRVELCGDVAGDRVAPSPGPGTGRHVATDAEFAAMLGRPVPEPDPILPFSVDTVVDDLDATRLGRLAQRAFLRIADRQSAQMLGDDPDPVLVRLTDRMIREAPLRFLVSMSGGTGSLKAFEGLTNLLSTLRITGRRGRDQVP